MNKHLLIVLCYVITFAAGAALGLVAPRTQSTRAPRMGSLHEQLHLTEQQQQQIRDIWSASNRDISLKFTEQRRTLGEDRRQAINNLLTPQQKTEYDRINADYNTARGELAKQAREAFDQIQQKTREILTDEQRARYDELITRRRTLLESRSDQHRTNDKAQQTTSPAVPKDSQ